MADVGHLTLSATLYETPSKNPNVVVYNIIQYMRRCALGGRENDRTVRREWAAHRAVPTENRKAHEDAYPQDCLPHCCGVQLKNTNTRRLFAESPGVMGRTGPL